MSLIANQNEKPPGIAVIGTGRMGPGIALSFAGGGCPVLLVGRGKPQLERAQVVIQKALDLMVNNGLVEGAAAEATTARLSISTDLAGISEAEIVVEATPEVLANKQKLLAEFEAVARSDAILASNTSGLPITQIAVGMRFPQRMVGMKFVIPAHLIPLVEVVKGQETDLEVMESACTVLRQIGKRPVKVMHDVPGFLNNRVQQAMRREALNLVARGIASAEDVDAAVQWGFGFRLLGAGTFESMDLVGLEQIHRIHSYILPDLDPPSNPSPLLQRLIAEGKTGAGAGQGFLAWDAAREQSATRRMETVMVELLKLLQRMEETPAATRDKTK
ncbi:MAG: 3-hydroxyacyl-CoA dehydrogenase family protein [Deltaproteobacteria bacterium]|nr:3-hydroxyacyl-CoA dehydrogenase family protein [Deltaproteobacteria bacterium]